MALLQQPLAGFSTDTAPDLSDRRVRERLSRAAIPAFFKLIQAWQVRDEAARQLLGGVSNGGSLPSCCITGKSEPSS